MAKFYDTCPDCGANLDPGETCDCKKSADTATVMSPTELRTKLEALCRQALSLREEGHYAEASDKLVEGVRLYADAIFAPYQVCAQLEMPFIATAMAKTSDGLCAMMNDAEKRATKDLMKLISVAGTRVRAKR